MTTQVRYFLPDCYYHIYNCGVEKRDIYTNNRDYHRFLQTIEFYLHNQRISLAQFNDLNQEAKQLYHVLNPKGLETLRLKLICYCLMPNHFHFVIKPLKERGLTQFISDISNSYTRYFNIKYERIGSLLQGTFKSKEITSEESLYQATRYIHLNPVFSSKTNPFNNLKPEFYPFSSYASWIGLNPKGLVTICQDEISKFLEESGGKKNYKEFVEAKMALDPAIGIENLIFDEN